LSYNITKTVLFKTQATRHKRALNIVVENLAFVPTTTLPLRAAQDE